MSCPASKIKPVRRLRTPANRLNLDYAGAAELLPRLPVPIIDVHSHISGRHATSIYRDVAELYGVGLTYTMTQFEQVETVRSVLGDRVRFIAVPNYEDESNRQHHLGYGFVNRIKDFYDAGARMVKFWAAPRGTDYAVQFGDKDFMRLDAPHRIEAMEAARELGMIFMTHVADPDTWFTGRYTDAALYGTKPEQYEPLEILLDRFDQPWIAAHMGGWPEDLEFLRGLLERHPNLHLDTSATKWMVRELSKHPRQDLIEFFTRFKGRILFGSDIVTSDDHIAVEQVPTEAQDGTPGTAQDDAFDLYASRYWSLRVLMESNYVGESPIADPDLSMVDPERFGPLDAPALIGKHLPADILRSIYHDAAHELLEGVYGAEGT